MSDHALLGPSSAKRWMECPPSARFDAQFEETPSPFAEEGTAAHLYAELLTICQIGGGKDNKAVQDFCASNEYYDGEMEEAISLYLDIINERYQALKDKDPSAIIMSEQRLDFSKWAPEGFGTGDIILIGAGVIEVIDLKYGKGIPVDAKDNPQLKIYGLGAWDTFRVLYDLNTVRMTIVQPRLGSVTTAEMSSEDLVKWADEEMAPKAKLAWDGAGEFKPGDHCRFCKALPRCEAAADDNLELAKHDFVLPGRLSNDDIADILGRIDRMVTWTKAVKEYALYEAENKGVKWPGWKLVEGRSNRVITDSDAAIKILLGAGYAEPLLYKPKEILNLTGLEKLTGKKKFATLLDAWIEKPPGKPTLVTEDDKRPELNTEASAKSDFEELIKE